MKNPYNLLVAVLVLVCLYSAGHRLYKTYQYLFGDKQGQEVISHVK